VSTPAATNQTAILEGRGFQIADTSLLKANAELGTHAKEDQNSSYCYKFSLLVRLGRSDQENAGFGEEHVIR
jgi:hypothetical protein